MDRSECTSRLLASAMHELRNALAVIRESVGLASDVARIQARGGDAAGNISKEMKDRTVEGFEDVQRQVSRASELADAVDFLGEAVAAGESSGQQCDLSRVTAVFSVLARRRARSFHMEFVSESSDEPVWCAKPVMDVFMDLLGVFDICSSAGGDVKVGMKAMRRKDGAGILLTLIAGGASKDIVVSALTGTPSIMPDAGGWCDRLMIWNKDDKKHFWLSLGTGQNA